MFASRATQPQDVSKAQWKGCGIQASCFSLLERLNVNNFVEILVKFPPVADFCIRTAIILMNKSSCLYFVLTLLSKVHYKYSWKMRA